MKGAADTTVGWAVSPGLTGYETAVAVMEARVNAIAAGQAGELAWLVEHPPLYTVGAGADPAELLDPGGLPVLRTGRGGRYTYHGPGQRVVYVMVDVGRRGRDVRGFVAALEAWLIDALARLGVRAGTRQGRVGVWVDTANAVIGAPTDATGLGRGDAKLAAIGVRLRRWVSFHGVALNVAPDLSRFAGIVPCGIAEHGVSSLQALGVDADMAQVDAALRAGFDAVFGATAVAGDPLSATGADRAGCSSPRLDASQDSSQARP